jgi:hypothetical protein
MEFSKTHSLVIQSVFHSEKGEEGARLLDIIGYVDYVNHAILTYQEFTESVEYAKACGLVVINYGKLKTTDTFKNWKNGLPKKLSVTKESTELLSFLNHKCKKPEALTNTPDFSEEEFNKAVKEYLKESR